jgi:ubiquinone/menaquinone biosynthesis C-methylase UbiE
MQTQYVNPQQEVNDYFQGSALYWRSVYSGKTLSSTIYRARYSTALQWIAKLALPPDARVLEVGCGAGLTTIALTVNGHTVDAMDSATAMLQMTRKKAARHGVEDKVRLHLGDVHALPFDSGTFDLVIAIGVIPWLHSEHVALQEMQRVLKSGGYLLATADNNGRLNRLLDPLSSPVLKPLRVTVKRLLQACGSWQSDSQFQAKRHYPRELNRLIAHCSFKKVKSCTVGFGPFTVFGKHVLDEAASIGLHRRLQNLSLRKGLFLLRWTGSHYVVLARKEETRA